MTEAPEKVYLRQWDDDHGSDRPDISVHRSDYLRWKNANVPASVHEYVRSNIAAFAVTTANAEIARLRTQLDELGKAAVKEAGESGRQIGHLLADNELENRFRKPNQKTRLGKKANDKNKT